MSMHLLLHALLLAPVATADELRFPAIVNGSVTNDPLAVTALTVEYDGALYGPFCSATVIDAEWALTAAHCVKAMEEDYAGYDIYLVSGGNLSSGVDDYVKVEQGIAHPDFDTEWYTDDIGLMELASGGLSGVTPLPLTDETIDASWVGKELRYVGYGITSDNAEDMGTKRYADIPIVTLDTDIMYGWDEEDGQNVCQGDSGGPALEILGGGDYQIAGVNAFVGLWKGQEGEDPCVDGFVGATRVDIHVDWISDETDGAVYIDTGGNNGGGSNWPGRDDGGWCAAAPNTGPSVAGLLVVLGLVGARRRNKSASTSRPRHPEAAAPKLAGLFFPM